MMLDPDIVRWRDEYALNTVTRAKAEHELIRRTERAEERGVTLRRRDDPVTVVWLARGTEHGTFSIYSPERLMSWLMCGDDVVGDMLITD